MRIILFDVDHGFCSFIKTPSGHSIMIDCGKGPNFSPAEYLLKYELQNAHPVFPLTKLVVTHPHDDHIEDAERVLAKLNPSILHSQNYNWDFLRAQGGALASHSNLDSYVAGKTTKFSGGSVQDPDFGIRLRHFSIHPNRAQQFSSSINSAVNNSGVVTVITFPGTKYHPKFLFGGDMECEGWEELLKDEQFVEEIRGVWFYFVSHHGHSSGFSTRLFGVMGKPALNIISVRHADESRDDRYSSEEFSGIWYVDGEERRMVSTTNDGSIFIDVDPEGLSHVHTHRLLDNLPDAKTKVFRRAGLLPPPQFRR